MKDLSRLISALHNSFNGKPWYGDPIMEILNKIRFEYVIITPENSNNSIAKIVAHMIQWRNFANEKLNGNNSFDIELNSKDDWPDVHIQNKKDWDELLESLINSQKFIINALEKVDSPDFLTKNCPGRTYNFEFLIDGIIQHDIYHIGQIGFIYQQLKNNNT